MLFADNPHDRQIEKLMSQIPNFKPRGHGIYIYEEKEYSAENCFCRECTYRRKKKRNSKTAPPCIEQRIRAGEVPLGEVLQETMLAITHPAFKSRLKEYIYETEIMYMEFKNERHQVVFTEAVQGLNRNDKALMSALYLLTADGKLWSVARRHIRKNGIDLKQITLRNSSEASYDTLYISHNNRNRFTFVKRRNYTGRKHAIPALRLKPYTIHLYRQHPGSAFGWTIPTKHHSKQQKLF